MLILFIRTFILYFFSVFIIRLMGKRQIGELQPHELVMTFMISDLASLSMQDIRYPLLLALLPMVTLLILKVVLTEIELRNHNFKDFIDGKPVIIIKDGKILDKVMKKQKLDVYDLFEEIREKGFLDINEIEYAVLENNGDISIFPKESFTPIQKKDLNIQSNPKIFPCILIFDGEIQEDSLCLIKKNSSWLLDNLKKENINDIKNVYLAILTPKDEFYIQKKY